MILAWQHVWRNGFVPQLTTKELTALCDAVRDDDPRLVQGQTTDPPPLLCAASLAIKCGCPLAYCAASSQGGFESLTAEDWRNAKKSNPNPATVERVEEAFSVLCYNAGRLLGDSRAFGEFVTFWDDSPRDYARQELLAEIESNLKERADATVCAADAIVTA